MGQSKSAKYYSDNPEAAEKKRKYQSEYQSSRKEKAKRAARNAARRKEIVAGNAKKFDGKDVHHRDDNPLNNSAKNRSVTSRKYNRGKK